jgi:hypothetical protein
LEEVHNIIAEAKTMKQSGLMVNFSGTHNQSDDPSGLLPKGDDVFGSRDNYEMVQKVKTSFDPTNRFRFHPFGHLL